MPTDIQDGCVEQPGTQPVRAAVIPLFSTWIYLCDNGPKHLNEQLEDLARRLTQDDRHAARRTNLGGWHYAFDLFALGDPVVSALRDNLEQHVQAFLNQLHKEANPTKKDRFRLQGWMNVNRTGNENLLHCHPAASWPAPTM